MFIRQHGEAYPKGLFPPKPSLTSIQMAMIEDENHIVRGRLRQDNKGELFVGVVPLKEWAAMNSGPTQSDVRRDD